MDRKILKILFCPLCKQKLKLRKKFLICLNCNKKYTIIDGIPIFCNDKKEYFMYTSEEEKVQFYNMLLDSYGFELLHKGNGEGYFRSICEVIIKNVPHSVEHIIDVGCGTGRILYEISSFYPSSNLIGFDISFRALKKINKLLKQGKDINLNLKVMGCFKNYKLKGKKVKNLHFIQGSVYNLPFDENTFDIVISCNLVDVLEHPIKALQNLIKVLRKQGFFLITTPMNWRFSYIWKIFPNRDSLINFFIENSIHPIVWFDNLIFRETVNFVRNSYLEWNIFLFLGQKK